MRTNLYLKQTVYTLFSIRTIAGRFDQSTVGFQSDLFLEWTYLTNPFLSPTLQSERIALYGTFG